GSAGARHGVRRPNPPRGGARGDDRERSPGRRDGPAGQFRHRGHHVGPAPGPRRHRPRPLRQVRGLLPRPRRSVPHRRRLRRGDDRRPFVARRAGRRGGGHPARALQRPRGRRAALRRERSEHRRGDRRAYRRQHEPRAAGAGLPRRPALPLRPPRRAAHPRRGDDRFPGGLGRRAEPARHPSRPDDPRQGDRRRIAARRLRRTARADVADRARRTRVPGGHALGQPAGGGGRPRGAGGAEQRRSLPIRRSGADGRAPAAGHRGGRPPAWHRLPRAAPGLDARTLLHRRAGGAPGGRPRHGPAAFLASFPCAARAGSPSSAFTLRGHVSVDSPWRRGDCGDSGGLRYSLRQRGSGGAMTHPDVLVLGGGIIGLACARELALRGLRVELVERLPAGAEASLASAGMLAPLGDFPAAGPFLDACRASRDLWGPWVAALESETGLGADYDTSGGLLVALDEEDEAELDRLAALAHEMGEGAEDVDPAALRRWVPDITPDVRRALHLRGEHRVDNVQLCAVLAQAAQKLGVILHYDSEAVRVEHRPEGTVLVSGHHWRKEARLLVLAAGAWSGLMPDLPPLPVRPVRGQIVLLGGIEWPWGGSVRRGLCYAVRRGATSLLVGSTLEEAGFARHNTVEGVEDLLAFTRRLFP